MRAPLILAATALLFTACDDRPGIDEVDPPLERLGKGLPRGFLLGTATAAHQVEGGNDNDWVDWEAGSFDDRPHIANGDRSGNAADSWNRFDQDLDLMKQLKSNGYRFSVEWARLEPQRGAWDAAAMARYKLWAQKLRAAGIEPLVTLWHFTLPRWVAAQGAWENPQTTDDFVAFTRRVAKELGPEVDWWCTLNEPNVYALEGYLEGAWPPGKRDDTATQAQVMATLFKAHGRAAAALREVDTVDADGDGRATMISVAHHVRVMQSASSFVVDQAITGLTDDFFNESTPRALVTGRIRLSVPGTVEIDEQVPGLAGSIDYLGVNYYTRNEIRTDLGSAALSQQYFAANRPTSSLGWDLYPDGLAMFLERFASWGVPLVITENGIADNDDTRRVRYLKQHLLAVELAVAHGADVRGYFYWALLDNFEWAEGFTPRFGMFHVSYGCPAGAPCNGCPTGSACTRTPTAAVETFRAIADHRPR